MDSASLLYDVSTRLAVGDAGLIYKATERTTGRAVVLKVLLTAQDSAHPLDADALLRDAPDISLMNGEGIVRLLNAFRDEDGAVLVYEFAEGTRGLDVPDDCPIPGPEAGKLVAQLLHALHCGEQYQYPHGDLKPGDIMLAQSPGGHPLVKVLDWGLANYRREPTPAALPYTAPERLAGAPPSHAADLFSAGAVLHFLFTGVPPVEAATKEENAAAWSVPLQPSIQELRPDLPAAILDLISRLLQPDPAQRPASAAEALQILAASTPVARAVVPAQIKPVPANAPRRLQPGQRMVTATGPVPRAGRTHRVVARTNPKAKSPAAFVISLLLLMGLGVAGLVIWKNTQPREKPGLADTPGPSAPKPPPTPQQSSPAITPKSAPVAAATSASVVSPASAKVSEPVKPPPAAGVLSATFSSRPTPPAVDSADIANLATETQSDKWFFASQNEKGAADAAKGVTFYTGTTPVLLRAITYKMANGAWKSATSEKPTTWTIRVGTASKRNFTLIASAQAEQTTNAGKGEYLTWTFATPVPLPADTHCAVDVAVLSRTDWTTGIPYLACSGNVTTPGVRELYNSGDNGAGSSSISRSETLDRIFHLDLEATPGR